MPKAEHSLVVHAPLDRLWQLLSEGITDPGRFYPGIERVEILERQAGSLTRRIRTKDYEAVERITRFEKRHEIDFLLVDHPHYAGQSRQRISELFETDSPGLSLTLTLSLDWRRKDREADDLDLTDTIRTAAERIKAAAEEDAA